MPYSNGLGKQVFKHGSRILEHRSTNEPLIFTFSGIGVGVVADELFLGFSSPSTVTIDWGDGNVITYTANYADFNSPYAIRFCPYNSNNPKAQYFTQYAYATGNASTVRTISVKINNRNYLNEVVCAIQFLQTPTLNMGQFKLLYNFSMRIPAATANLKGIFASSLNSVSYQLTAGTSVPIDLCYATINSLTLFTNANMNNLSLLTNIKGLKSLRLDWLSPDAYQTGSPIPPSFSQLTITSFGGYVGNYATSILNIPTVMNSITTLVTLQWPGQINAWTDLSKLVNLTTLSVLCIDFTNHCPDFLLNINCKSLTITSFGSSKTAAAFLTLINAAIDNMYTWAVANAPITGTVANKARNQIRTYLANGNIAMPKPSGTYQAPSGYALGTSNGTPASQLEKLYVLVNQYKWVFSGVPTS